MEDSTHDEDSGTLHPIEQVAGITQKSHWTIRWRVKHGHMRAIRKGKRLYFSTAELLRVLEEPQHKRQTTNKEKAGAGGTGSQELNSCQEQKQHIPISRELQTKSPRSAS